MQGNNWRRLSNIFIDSDLLSSAPAAEQSENKV